MIWSPLTSAHRLRDELPNLMWGGSKNKLSRQYSSVPFDSHVTQSFAHLQQGLDELLKIYFHCASKLLLKIHHTSDMSNISAEGLNHNTVVYVLNSRELRASVVGHCSVEWRNMGDCFRDKSAFGAGYERAKGYGRAEFNTPKASTINEVKPKKDRGPCFRCSGPHFQNTCTRYLNKASSRPLELHSQDRITKELLTDENSMSVEVII